VRKYIQLRVIIGALVVLIVAQMLNTVLSISSFEDIYRSSFVSRYQIVSNDLKRKIETSVNFGKPIDKFRGIEKILENIMNLSPNLEDVFVTFPDNSIIYSSTDTYIGKKLDISASHNFKDINISSIDSNQFEKTILEHLSESDKTFVESMYSLDEKNSKYILNSNLASDEKVKLVRVFGNANFLSRTVTIHSENMYYIGTPVYYDSEKLVGVIYIKFNEQIINEKVNEMIYNNMFYILMVLPVAIIVLFFLLLIVNKAYFKSEKTKRISLNARNLIVVLIVLVLAQASYSFLNTSYFQRLTSENVNSNINDLSTFVKDFIENDLLGKGASIDKMKGVEVALEDIIENTPSCKEINITNTAGDVQYLANKEMTSSIFDEKFNIEINQQKLNTNLKAAEDAFSGDIFIDESNLRDVIAENQETKTKTNIKLPTMFLGDEIVADNNKLISQMVGETNGIVSIFQYVKEINGLIRISTNLKMADNSKSLWTYMPSSSNIYQTIMGGSVYKGESSVVGSKYITIYKPIYDVSNNIVGSLAVGVEKKTIGTVDLTPSKFQLVTELKKHNEIEGYIVLHTDKEFIEGQTYDLIMDSATVIAVSLIFSFQILIFTSLLAAKSKKKKEENLSEAEEIERVNELRDRKHKIFRIAAFLFFLAEFIPLSFLPMFISKIYEFDPISIFNLARQSILGLPISAYMLGVTISVLVAGLLIRRITTRHSFFIFSLFMIAGLVLAGFATNILQLIIYRFISGLGYGVIVVSGVNLIIQNTSFDDRTIGFGFWFVGYSSANICAVPIGGVIASRIGYSTSMFVAAFFGLCLLLFVFFFIENVKPKKTDLEARPKFKFSDILAVFRDRSLFSLLFFASIPAQITFVGFFTYAFPLYLTSLGMSQSNIGRLLTLYGILLLLSPTIGKLSDKIKNERLFIILGNIILGLALLLFYFSEGLLIIIVAIVAIGVGDVLVSLTKSSYITLSKEASKIGESKLSSIFLTFEKIGTVVAPIIAGILITAFNYSYSIVIIGAITIVSILLFAIISQNLRRV